MRYFIILALSLFWAACAYRFGYGDRSLPGGHQKVAIPVFENQTSLVGAETYFTNAIIREFVRSKVAEVTSKDQSQAVIEGIITEIAYKPVAQKKGGDSEDRVTQLPSDTVLTTEYRIEVSATVRLRQKSDNQIIWQGGFKKEKTYSAPQIGLEVVNTANPLYNHSARHENIRLMAKDMMAEAYGRMTENF
ncbi:MAG: LptE family protein [Pseudobdellovibrionaceae bacterium]|nr:MAG: LptE family protein [Pseudobdellovibrionaceae bacterium]